MIPSGSTPHYRLLVIDDNPAIHEDFRKILAGADPATLAFRAARAAMLGEGADPGGPATPLATFTVDTALQGRDGCALLQQAQAAGQPYALAFVDVRMPPGWDGIETIAELWRVSPELQVVLCTAYSDYSWEDIQRRLGASARLLILKKPFDNIEVLQLAHTLTQKWQLERDARDRLAELDRLVEARSAALAESQRRLFQAHKLEAVGQLAAGIAHDFNNILTVIQGYTGLLLAEKGTSQEVGDPIVEIHHAAERAATLTRQILAFSCRQVIKPLPHDLNQTLGHLLRVLPRLIGEHIAVRPEFAAAPLHALVDPACLDQAILNLVLNARDAMPEGGTLRIRTAERIVDAAASARHPEARPGRFATIEVCDSGCGMPPEVLQHIFEPFYTTKEIGKGTGLGLASVYGVIKQHQGWIEAASTLGEGSTFTLFLPLAPVDEPAAPPAGRPGAAAPRPPRTGRGQRLLVAEDEEGVRAMVATYLRHQGYEVVAAVTGDEALEIWQREAGRFDLLLTDVVMPGQLSGVMLAETLRATRPQLRVIYTSGYDNAGLSNQADVPFIPKPYRIEELAELVRRVLAAPIGAIPAGEAGEAKGAGDTRSAMGAEGAIGAGLSSAAGPASSRASTPSESTGRW